MKKGQDKNEISIKEIEERVKQLKKLDKSWAEKLSTLIAVEKEGFSVTKVYDIVNSRNKHQADRGLFIKHADLLLVHLKSVAKQFKELSSSLA